MITIEEFELLAVAFGGGRNGAMLLGMYERGIKPHLITFANTGRLDRTEGEKKKTYENVDRMSKWCEEHFGIPITIVHKDSMYASLYDNCVRTSTLPSAAYGLRSCSDKWKIQPQDKFMNNYVPALRVWSQCWCGHPRAAHLQKYEPDAEGKRHLVRYCPDQTHLPSGSTMPGVFTPHKVTKAIGYDAGEPERAKIEANDKYVFRYFLIEWGWYLEDCIEAYKRHGLPVPPKSACYYCPSSTKEEVLRLSIEEPELYKSAVAMEDKAIASGNLKTVKGLGRHWTWREIPTTSDFNILPDAPKMTCACFDGDDDL